MKENEVEIKGKSNVVEGTPFRVITNKEGRASITLGDYLVKDNIDNEDEAIDLIINKDWEVLLTSCGIYMNWINQFDENESRQNENKKNQ